ncbi:MAG: hypothetical protein WC506_00845 [Candidatus Micrarchaeia archaeon]
MAGIEDNLLSLLPLQPTYYLPIIFIFGYLFFYLYFLISDKRITYTKHNSKNECGFFELDYFDKIIFSLIIGEVFYVCLGFLYGLISISIHYLTSGNMIVEQLNGLTTNSSFVAIIVLSAVSLYQLKLIFDIENREAIIKRRWRQFFNIVMAILGISLGISLFAYYSIITSSIPVDSIVFLYALFSYLFIVLLYCFMDYIARITGFPFELIKLPLLKKELTKQLFLLIITCCVVLFALLLILHPVGQIVPAKIAIINDTEPFFACAPAIGIVHEDYYLSDFTSHFWYFIKFNNSLAIYNSTPVILSLYNSDGTLNVTTQLPTVDSEFSFGDLRFYYIKQEFRDLGYHGYLELKPINNSNITRILRISRCSFIPRNDTTLPSEYLISINTLKPRNSTFKLNSLAYIDFVIQDPTELPYNVNVTWIKDVPQFTWFSKNHSSLTYWSSYPVNSSGNWTVQVSVEWSDMNVSYIRSNQTDFLVVDNQ